MVKSNKIENHFKHSILITGGAGFIGSHLSNYLIKKYKNYKIIVLDKLDYCSNINNLKYINSSSSSGLVEGEELNLKFYKGNILDSKLLNLIFTNEKIDIVFHLAAYTHVDHSFKHSIKFTENNVMGTHYLLEVCKNFKILKFIYVSTDEVYGSGLLDDDDSNNEFNEFNDENYNETIDSHKEDKSILKPTNPYSASKAGAEHLVQSYYKSFKLPIIITRANNIYGPCQYPEKIIPKFINLLLNNKKCTIHGNGENKRSFLFIDDIISAFDILLNKGEIGNIYNIGTDFEITNLEVAKKIINLYKNSTENSDNSDDNYNSLIKFINDRPFNDHRYNINYSKLSKLGWNKTISWDQGIQLTFNWYLNNKNYWSNFNIKDYYDNGDDDGTTDDNDNNISLNNISIKSE